MDKYDLVIDIVGHPEKYPAEQLEKILSHAETREIYNLMCETVSAVKETGPADIDAQWQSFCRRRINRPRRMLWSGSRAASIAVLLFTSLVAVAIGVAVAVSVAKPAPKQIAGDTPAAVFGDAVTAVADTIAAGQDSEPVAVEPIMFEDAALQTIMDEVAKTYHVKVIFNNSASASLHLYYKFDPSLSLDEIIGQLNNFEQINITRTGNTVNIN